LRKWRLLTSE